ncbi:MAG: glycosyltransferase, partial [Acidobacteria bacterium]|nr:glycosyltransferase [Acidobacteriota bacterium]
MRGISVVIPTHNRCATLRCALESLANQSLGSAEYEVIVVADGCDDLVVGFLGGCACTNYGENNSLMAITRNYSVPVLMA